MKKKGSMQWLVSLVLFTWAVSSGVWADEVIPYPLQVCLISGAELGSMGDPVRLEHEDRGILLCCGGCIGRFEANAKDVLKELDRKIIEQQKEAYPLTTCIVSGEKLGSHGTPLDIVFHNRLVRLCCQGCLAEFERAPDPFIKKLDEAKAGKATTIPADAEHGHHEHHHHQ